jgi:hypothetical protein
VNTQGGAFESQQHKLNLILKVYTTKAVSNISVMTDFVEENYAVICEPV